MRAGWTRSSEGQTWRREQTTTNNADVRKSKIKASQALWASIVAGLQVPVIAAPMFLVLGLTDVARVSHASKAIDSGVNGLILLCAVAGGHIGWINPFAFVTAFRAIYDGPIVLAGAISNGRQSARRRCSGRLRLCGYCFIAAPESDAPAEYRPMVAESVTDDIILIPAVSGLPANWLRSSLTRPGYTNLK